MSNFFQTCPTPPIADEKSHHLIAQDKFLSNTLLKSIFDNEQTDCICSGGYMNAFASYPLLQGQQTDLYKCVLVNSFDMVNNNGYIGMLHPESVYDDPKGQPLRSTMYKRLRYHFQYQNALNLFDIAHRRKYGSNIYGATQERISFININNLFHPTTIDSCFSHDGHGQCGGLKDENGKWNILGHKKRIINYSDGYIKLLSDTFEEGEAPNCAKLVSMHTGEVLEVLYKLSKYNSNVHQYEPIITECLHETGAPNEGVIVRNTCFPDIENYEMIYSAPQFYVGNPYYKTPRSVCKNKGDYDTLSISDQNNDIKQRTNYTPLLFLNDYKAKFAGFVIGQNSDGTSAHDCWLDYYHVDFRKMINLAGERSLIWLHFVHP